MALLVATVFGCDLVLGHASLPYLVQAIPDEAAHVATALLLLWALPWAMPQRFLLGYIPASFLIDLDHIPIAIGYEPLIAGAHRPYTHSALTILVLLLFGVGLREGRRLVLWGAACGVAVHLIRDLATGYIPLFWPLVHRDASLPYTVYVAALLLAAALSLLWGAHAQIGRARAVREEHEPLDAFG